MKKLQVAVVTGAHPFEVKAFHELWKSWPGVDAYVQDLNEFTYEEKAPYDVVVLYLHHRQMPSTRDVWFEKHWPRLEAHLSQPGLGILVWHHAIPAFHHWSVWDELTGLPRRDFPVGWDGPMNLTPVEGHPLVAGWKGCSVVEEWYGMDKPDGEPFLTTDHAHSGATLGWTRQFRGNRVACLQPGHGLACWTDPDWRELFLRTLRWTVGLSPSS